MRKIQDHQIGSAMLIALAAERIGFMLPEEVVVGGRLVLLIVTGILAYLIRSLFGNTIQCVFVLCPFRGLLFFLIVAHKGSSFRFLIRTIKNE